VPEAHDSTTATRDWGDSTAMMAAAGIAEDTSYYGTFDASEQRAVQTIAQRIQGAWAANDPDAFADIFAENGSLLMQDTQLTSREEIRAFMTGGFAGPYKGAHVEGGPLQLHFLSDDVALLVTRGGIILGGETSVDPSRVIRAVWVIVRRAPGKLELVSHQSSPVHG
jgi:uncharacterized protein (TIGR02246 family)